MAGRHAQRGSGSRALVRPGMLAYTRPLVEGRGMEVTLPIASGFRVASQKVVAMRSSSRGRTCARRVGLVRRPTS
ncbi:MAG: hypothetical protein QME96_17730, partial [Myxococcota bacterium]|nr:hypothetical protein [Myxococcota bacterium]